MPELLKPLAHPVYRRLFSAQVIALLGTGLSTVALALLAYDLAGENAGAALAVVLSLKMVAYVTVSPVVTALARNVSRRRLLIGLDLGRAALVMLIPLVEALWQVYLLVFLLNACSAGFTPTFQAVIPDVLTDIRRYTEALSLSRLAYDLEALLSPIAAAVLLGLVSYNALFALNGVAFLVSASIVFGTAIPLVNYVPAVSGAIRRVGEGIRVYLATPRLLGLLALSFAAACAGAMVIVNTVVFARDEFDLADAAVAWGLAAAGAGSILAALALPSALRSVPDRFLMITGGAALVFALLATYTVTGYWGMIACWVLIGVGMSLIQTPGGRLIRRSADSAGRPALFAAQFSLSHLCWLVAYPVAGFGGQLIGLDSVALVLGIMALVAVVTAVLVWRPESGPFEADDRPLRPGRTAGFD